MYGYTFFYGVQLMLYVKTNFLRDSPVFLSFEMDGNREIMFRTLKSKVENLSDFIRTTMEMCHSEALFDVDYRRAVAFVEICMTPSIIFIVNGDGLSFMADLH